MMSDPQPKLEPLQSYEDTSEPDKGPQRLAVCGGVMADAGLDGLLVPRTDEHQSEYLPAYAERVAWLTGFTGSNAFVLVLPDEARVFTDGRYTLQVRAQTVQPDFTPDDMVDNPPAAYLGGLDLTGKTIGYDPWLHTIRGFKAFTKAAEKAGAILKPTPSNLIDAIWTDRPGRPHEPITVIRSTMPASHSPKRSAPLRRRSETKGQCRRSHPGRWRGLAVQPAWRRRAAKADVPGLCDCQR
jgi:hypothetical protein